MKIGIIGGGITGLSTAFYLSKNGFKVTIFEKEKKLGGLSRSEEIVPGVLWDKYYHVILTTDYELLSFIDEIGLKLDIDYTETKTGFYTDGKLHSMSSVFEFLRFEPLSLLDKLRLGAGIFYASKTRNADRLEKIYAKQWLVNLFGRRNYEKIWEPLLRAKAGAAKDELASSFIWAYIKRYYGTRSQGSKKELMGCVRGGYHSIINRLEDVLKSNDVNICLNHEVTRVEIAEDEKIKIFCKKNREFVFDKVIGAMANPILADLCSYLPREFIDLLYQTSYLGLVCVCLFTKKSLSPFYVINLTDPGIPFTGIIEATHVVSGGLLGKNSLVYLPKYLTLDDEFVQKPDEEILRIFLAGLKVVFPDFIEDDVIRFRVDREKFVQPILKVGYLKSIPPMDTPMKNLYLINTSMIKDSNVNNNEAVKLGRRMAKHIIESMNSGGLA